MLPMLFASRFQRRYQHATYLVSNAYGNSKFLRAGGFCDRGRMRMEAATGPVASNRMGQALISRISPKAALCLADRLTKEVAVAGLLLPAGNRYSDVSFGR